MNLYLKHFLRAVLIGIGVFLVLLLIQLALGNTLHLTSRDLAVRLGYNVGYSVTIYMANMMVFLKLDRAFRRNRFSRKRLFMGFLASFAVSILCIFILRLLEQVVIEGKSFRAFIESEIPANYLVAVIITMFVTLAIHALYFYRLVQEARVKEQRVIAGTASAKFESLKNQIDPHFLFNSLNVLSSLIEENPENAQRFTSSLSKTYRYVLEQKDKELVSLQEELDFAATYMKLLKMRFEGSLEYSLPSAPIDPEAKVVPLSLQLLLENTVKHNVVSEKKPLHIDIEVEGNYLSIRNNLQKKDSMPDRKGVGLQNIVSRYAIITNRKVSVIEDADQYIVKIPILTKIISVMNVSQNESTSFYRAQKKVEEIKGFYGNLGSYIAVMIVLAVINLVTYPQYLWVLFPAAGWGIGVLFHGMAVFNYIPFLGSDWEERKIREIMNREKTSKWH